MSEFPNTQNTQTHFILYFSHRVTYEALNRDFKKKSKINAESPLKTCCFYKLCCLSPPGGVPCQAEEGVDCWCPCLVSSALQSAQPASQGETEGEGK